MVDYKTKVELIAVTRMVRPFPKWFNESLSDGDQLVEYCGRLAYDTQAMTNQVEGWVQRRIADGHESLIEHAYGSWHIWCSRVVSHELVRHRIASYTQRSQRFVTEGRPRFVTPPGLKGAELRMFKDAMARAWYVYGQLLKAGHRPEIARYVLPNACQTQIVMTMNLRSLRNFLALRTSTRALPEIQEVAGKIGVFCRSEWPQAFGDLAAVV